MQFKYLNKLIKEIESSSNANIEKTLEYHISKRRTLKSVLGFDIYHYSQFTAPTQDIIPFIFESILRETNEFSATFDSFLYQKYEKQFYEKLISTGDGGFIIFENPLEALVFLLYFNLNLKYFNSFHSKKKTRELIGPLSIRFSITYDYILEYQGNSYGPAIINNARIMSMDKLNRLIIDKNTHDWFEKNTFGLENLPNLTVEMLMKLEYYKYFQLPKRVGWYINDDNLKNVPKINSVDVLKIGESEIKKNKLDTYNLIVSYSAKLFKNFELTDTEEFKIISLNLGNYNTSGL